MDAAASVAANISLEVVSIPFIGSNLFKFVNYVRLRLKTSNKFQSPLSGQICLNTAVEAAELFEIEIVSIPFIGSNLFKFNLSS